MAYELPNSIKKKIHSKIIKTEIVELSKKAEKLKQLMIDEFNSHPVTIEIKAGPYAPNYSGTLVGTEKGNLFSFIGFQENANPITPILEKLNNIKIITSGEYENSFLNIVIPKIEEFWEVTPMPWQEGRSWAKGIESGISGLNYYLFSISKNFESSRSGPSIQSNKNRSGARYVPTQYLSTILKKYKTKFSSLYRRDKNIFTLVE